MDILTTTCVVLIGGFGGLTAWWWPVQTRLADLLARSNEQHANIRFARAKRDAVLAQLMALTREYAGHEAGIFQEAQSYGAIINILGTIPARYPTITANSHFAALMQDVRREHAEMQAKLETHNRYAAEYNAIVQGPSVLMNPMFMLQEPENNCYLDNVELETVELPKGS